jgi:sigma-B regulation protein RsbQ
MSVLARNNVVVHGPVGGRPMLFAHGFGCDQNMWRSVWPAFAGEYRVVLFDHVSDDVRLLVARLGGAATAS